MKILCLDKDNCGYHKYLTIEECTEELLSKKYHLCPECDYFMTIVTDSYDLEEEEANVKIAVNKLFRRINKEFK
jgi:hypothetical protein